MIKKWNDWSINIKLTFAFALLILLVSGSLTVGVMFQLSNMQRQGLQERLYDIVSFSIPQVDGDYHSLIRDEEDETSPFYNVILVRLQVIQNTSSIIKRIYTLRISKENHLTYVVDASSDGDHKIGALYHQDNPVLVNRLKSTTKPIVADNYFADTTGTVLSGYAPIYNQFGELDGYLGIDIDTSGVEENAARVQRTALLVFLLTVPFALFIGWRIAVLFNSPIKDLVNGADQASKGNLDYIVPVRNNDELGVLADAFNRMTDRLKNTLDGLEEEIIKYRWAEKVQDVIFRISQAVTSTDTIDEMYRTIHKILGELIPVDNFFIALYDQTTDTISFPYFVDQNDSTPLKRKLTKGLTEYVMHLRRPFLANQQELTELAIRNEIHLQGSVPIDWLGAPLIVEDHILGVVAVQSYSESIRYNQENLNLLEFISNQIALAIEHKTATEKLQNSNDRYRSLFENSPISLWEEDFSVVKQITDEMKNEGVKDIREYLTNNPEIIRQCAAEVRVLDVNNATLEMFGAKNKDELLNNLSKIFIDETYDVFKEEIINITNGLTEFNWEGINQTLKGKKIDVSIKWSVAPGHEKDLSKVIISMIDVTKRRQTENKLRYISSHDALTGLYNRAYFDEEMARLDNSRQYPISVVMVDVDKLKTINDSEGHQAGDMMLQKAAAVLNEVFRTEDVVARIGGDEFAILLPNIDKDGANKTIARIRENVKKQNASTKGRALSLSLGVSTAYKPGKLAAALIEADSNMYLDKAGKQKQALENKTLQ
jgi:diguanylate cyclase (GGDEF)-like protein/PAS domain S-box-containing protein